MVCVGFQETSRFGEAVFQLKIGKEFFRGGIVTRFRLFDSLL